MNKTWEPEFVISSGSYMLDNSPALNNYKGLPSGIMVQIASRSEGSFKTSLSLAGAIEIQKMGGKVGYIDAESGITGSKWLEGLGLDLSPEKWEYFEPIDGEEAFSKAEEWMRSGEFKGIVIDSIDATQPSSILTSEFGDAHIGNHAKLVTAAVRRFKTLVRRHQCILWLVNQMRVNMTQMGARGYKTTGGDAIDFYCKLNIEMNRAKSVSQLMEDKYIPLKIKVHRTKLGDQSWTEIDSYGYQGKGIDKSAELVHLALEKGMIRKAGSWFKQTCDLETGEAYETKDQPTIGQTIESAREFVRANKEYII